MQILIIQAPCWPVKNVVPDGPRPSSSREFGWGRHFAGACANIGETNQPHTPHIPVFKDPGAVRRVRYVTVDAGPQLQATSSLIQLQCYENLRASSGVTLFEARFEARCDLGCT